MTKEITAECPVCGHQATILVDTKTKERIVYCPDKYCINCKDKTDK